MAKKLLYVVLDGLGDRPIKALGGKTPLEAAETPRMDGLAKDAKLGYVYTVGENIAPESDVAVISILGYEADKFYTGRGPLESYAEGLEVRDGDLAYRVNFATKEVNSRKIIDRRVGRNLTTGEASSLAKEVNKKVKLNGAGFVFKNTIGHRGVLVIRKNEGRLCAEVTNTDPAYEREGVYGVAKAVFEKVIQVARPTEEFKNSIEAGEAARLTNEFVEESSKVLENSEVNKKRKAEHKLPANLILTRDGGDRLPEFPQISELFNLKIGCFVEMPVEKGIALLTGMEIVKLPLPTKDLKKDYILRARKVQSAMKAYDGLYIHIKGPDEPAHDGNYQKKKESIELIDKYFFGELLSGIDLNNVIIAVTADHSTPSEMKAHSGDPVPLMVSGKGFAPDGLNAFSEKEAIKGSLGLLKGHELMKLFISFLG
ncbi:MAG: 2,3-bisphosphoglycerate-independent phosphoglycerate mutase [Candidatus Omnitrophota bacterium]|nr:MAG: 2,3-bisphosphoglycerate-independent phosphoglycerate mutase [Candidatus Omnitrophota bacterium]